MLNDADDEFCLEDELPIIEDEDSRPTLSWKIMVVDDDSDVHEATRHALVGIEILGRSLHFIDAYSAAEAEAMLVKQPDIAVILLDVVMETQDAGLELVGRIRRGLGLTMPRIILRTGQPGYVPELKAIRDYDINDYKTKNELTRNRLFTSVLASLRAYDQLLRVEANRRGLEQIVTASGELLAHEGLQSFAAGVIRQLAALVGVDADGLLCAQVDLNSADDDRYVILAAAGRYEPFIRRGLDEIDDAYIVAALRRCLDGEQHVIEQDRVVLHFALRGHRSFAAYIKTQTIPEVEERNLLEVFCANVSVCADNIQLINRLQNFAYFDGLVGLPNRTAFVQAVDKIYEENRAAGHCVVLVDIDQFAEINNAFGHEHGDRLLKEVGNRLSQSFNHGCIIARLSGDAFGILGQESELDPNRLRAILKVPYLIGNVEQTVAASTGIVRLSDSGPNGQSVLKDASIARKLAREKGINSDAYYTPSIGFLAKERTYLLQQLHGAFAQDRLFSVYQPQVDLETGKLIGFEALMRWRNEKGEFVPPERFIPLAEQSGLIVGMGTWIMRGALFILRQLNNEGHTGLRMSVNVSAVQFRMPDFLATVDRALADTGIEATMLELEVTESVAMMGQNAVADTLASIRQRGIGVAIDDFGTGYSSLSYLDRLPIDRIKIDRSFVNAMGGDGDGRRIADLVIQLGHSLGMRVIAEGVETEAQAKRLLELGCHEAQGFLYGYPMNIDDLRVWLQKWTGRVA